MSKPFEPRGLATAIGSMPHHDPHQACSLVLKHLPEIPVWPQLPKRSFLENMYAQFSEGLPGVVVEGDRIYVNRSHDLSGLLEGLYAAYLESDFDRYRVGEGYAAGLHTFLKEKAPGAVAVKGQITGPVSMGLALVDQDRRPLLYDPVMADAIAKLLRLKAAWQERKLRQLHPNTIIFVDEPSLSQLGSAFVPIPEAQVKDLLEEVLGGIGGLKGIHCCGNTDWSLLLSTPLDILSFDAYNYGETLTLYPKDVERFLGRGGIIAWGIVPNDETSLAEETPSSLVERLEGLFEALLSKGLTYDKLISCCLITPSCALASLSAEAAARVLELTAEVSIELRKKDRR